MRVNQKQAVLILFGKRLRAIREAANISQEQIQYATGISQSQIARIESGDINTGIVHVNKLANFFGLEDHELFLFKSGIPESEDLKKGVARYLKSNNIDPTIFLKKSIVFYIESKVLNSRFLTVPRFAKEIVQYLEEKHNAKFTTSGISQALERFRKRGLVEKIPTDKKTKFQYRKKSS